MPDERAWDRWGRYGVAAALAAVISWFAFVARREVPILDWFDLGVHEAGHMVTAVLPRMVMFVGGSLAQIAVPLALAWYFGMVRRDLAGGGFCLAWAGTSAWDVSAYIADAPVQALPLVGGGQHDWAYLLGPHGWNVMGQADSIAGIVDFTGAVLAMTGIVVASRAMIVGLRAAPAEAIERADELEEHPGVAVDEPDPWLAAAQLPFHHEPTESVTHH